MKVSGNEISVILIDDHSLVRDGIRSLLESKDNIQVVAEASNGADGIKLIEELSPDIAIVDINMPGMSGIETIKQITDKNLSTKCLVLSMHDSKEYVLDSIKSGALGYILKDIESDDFIRAIVKVSQGKKYYGTDIASIVVNGYLEILQPNNSPSTIEKVDSSNTLLTRREQEIMHLAISGLSNKDMAVRLNKSVRTVETHRFNLMKKMNARNVVELAQKAKELGLT